MFKRIVQNSLGSGYKPEYMSVNCYSWAFSALKIIKKIALCLQFMVLVVEIVNIFVLEWIYKVETPFFVI